MLPAASRRELFGPGPLIPVRKSSTAKQTLSSVAVSVLSLTEFRIEVAMEAELRSQPRSETEGPSFTAILGQKQTDDWSPGTTRWRLQLGCTVRMAKTSLED